MDDKHQEGYMDVERKEIGDVGALKHFGTSILRNNHN
jgi:hypothetical protein